MAWNYAEVVEDLQAELDAMEKHRDMLLAKMKELDARKQKLESRIYFTKNAIEALKNKDNEGHEEIPF